MKQILFILSILVFMSSMVRGEKFNLKGTGKIGFEYIDLTHPENNSSVDPKLTTIFNVITIGKYLDNDVVGYIKGDYNNNRYSDKLDIKSMHLEFNKKSRKIVLGEFYDKLSEYSLYSEKVEGISYSNDYKKLNITFFGGIANRKKDYTIINTSPEYRRWMTGSKVNINLSDKEKLGVSAIYTYDDDSVNTGTVYSGPVKEKVVALDYENSYLDDSLKLNFNAAKNITDKNYNDTTDEVKGNAYKILATLYLTKNWEMALKQEYFGPEFYTSGNKTINSSDAGYKGYLLRSTWNFDKFYAEEEVEFYKENFKTSIVTSYRYFTSQIKYYINKTDKLSLKHIFKNSYSDSQTENKDKNTYNVGYNTKYKLYNLYLNTTYSKTSDKLKLNNDIENYGISFSTNARIFKNKFYNMWYFLWNKTKQSTGESKFYLLTFNGNYKVIPGKMDLIGKSSYRYTQSTDISKNYKIELQAKYRLSMEKVFDFTFTKEKTTGGTSIYDLDSVSFNYTMLF